MIKEENEYSKSDIIDKVSLKNNIRNKRNTKIRYERSVPGKFIGAFTPINNSEQKVLFLTKNLTPTFQIAGSLNSLEDVLYDGTGIISFELFHEAKRILDLVIKKFKTIDDYLEASFGKPITLIVASEKILEYIENSQLPTDLDVIWCEDLIGSALMCSSNMDKLGNSPTQRKFTLLLKTNAENTYLRDKGIVCLLNHEIGTHYLRSFNEGLQPWYGRRELFGLSSIGSLESITIEEGLACLNTIYSATHRYLGIPALLYYSCCMAEYLTFKELFQHIGKFVRDEEQRWKHCMRIKRCLSDSKQYGGYGKDQRYFEGAVKILKNLCHIDFKLLMAGKLTPVEVEKVNKWIITNGIQLPYFMLSMSEYKKQLTEIAKINGIVVNPNNQCRCHEHSHEIKLKINNKLKSFQTTTHTVKSESSLPSILREKGGENTFVQEKSGNMYENKRKRATEKGLSFTSVKQDFTSRNDLISSNKLFGGEKSSPVNPKHYILNEEIRMSYKASPRNLQQDTDVATPPGSVVRGITDRSDIHSFFNFGEISDITPVAVIMNATLRSTTDKQVLPRKSKYSIEHKSNVHTIDETFANRLVNSCGCVLFMTGKLEQHSSNMLLYQCPLILELNLQHPLSDSLLLPKDK